MSLVTVFLTVVLLSFIYSDKTTLSPVETLTVHLSQTISPYNAFTEKPSKLAQQGAAL